MGIEFAVAGEIRDRVQNERTFPQVLNMAKGGIVAKFATTPGALLLSGRTAYKKRSRTHWFQNSSSI